MNFKKAMGWAAFSVVLLISGVILWGFVSAELNSRGGTPPERAATPATPAPGAGVGAPPAETASAPPSTTSPAVDWLELWLTIETLAPWIFILFVLAVGIWWAKGFLRFLCVILFTGIAAFLLFQGSQARTFGEQVNHSIREWADPGYTSRICPPGIRCVTAPRTGEKRVPLLPEDSLVIANRCVIVALHPEDIADLKRRLRGTDPYSLMRWRNEPGGGHRLLLGEPLKAALRQRTTDGGGPIITTVPPQNPTCVF